MIKIPMGEPSVLTCHERRYGMKYTGKGIAIMAILIIVLGVTGQSFANKSSVVIEAPESAEKGSEITIKIYISHKGNSMFHYTALTHIKVNGKEVAKWEYSSSNRPESGNFTKEIKIRVTETIEIIAETFCNMHGSAGPATRTVKAR